MHTTRTSWARALALALVVHAIVVGSLWRADAFAPSLAEPDAEPTAEPELVPIVFEEPPRFTEVPDDHRSAPPEAPTALSNESSRAADLTPDADDDLPAQDGLAEAPAVALSPVTPTPPTPKEPPRETETRSNDAWAASVTARPLANPVRALFDAPSAPSGTSDIRQEASRHLAPGAALGTDIRLSTVEWDYAWWVQAFRRRVLSNWNPPSGFRFGLIGGWTLVEIEIDRNGRLLRSGVVDRQGHDALHESSELALTRSDPYIPLPSDFPDKTLTLQVRMAYHLRPRPR